MCTRKKMCTKSYVAHVGPSRKVYTPHAAPNSSLHMQIVLGSAPRATLLPHLYWQQIREHNTTTNPAPHQPSITAITYINRLTAERRKRVSVRVCRYQQHKHKRAKTPACSQAKSKKVKKKTVTKGETIRFAYILTIQNSPCAVLC